MSTVFTYPAILQQVEWSLSSLGYSGQLLHNHTLLLRLCFSSEQKRKKFKINVVDSSIPFARVHSLKKQDKLIPQ